MIDIIELVEGNLASMLNSGEIECPSDDCDNRRFHVNVWRDDDGSVVGDASCRDCNLEIELDLSNEPIDTAEARLTNLRNDLHEPPSPTIDRNELETVK